MINTKDLNYFLTIGMIKVIEDGLMASEKDSYSLCIVLPPQYYAFLEDEENYVAIERIFKADNLVYLEFWYYKYGRKTVSRHEISNTFLDDRYAFITLELIYDKLQELGVLNKTI